MNRLEQLMQKQCRQPQGYTYFKPPPKLFNIRVYNPRFDGWKYTVADEPNIMECFPTFRNIWNEERESWDITRNAEPDQRKKRKNVLVSHGPNNLKEQEDKYKIWHYDDEDEEE